MKRTTALFAMVALKESRCVGLAVLFALLAPAPAIAQADQPTILTCASSNGVQANLTINSARTMVTIDIISPSGRSGPLPGSVTSVTDQQIAMTFSNGFDPTRPDDARWVLNRYSLQLVQASEQQIIYTCQQQHRQL